MCTVDGSQVDSSQVDSQVDQELLRRGGTEDVCDSACQRRDETVLGGTFNVGIVHVDPRRVCRVIDPRCAGRAVDAR